MPSPANKNWNLSTKTASATYDRLSLGIGKPLTDRRIEHYRRLGYYGETQQATQLEQDGKDSPAVRAARVAARRAEAERIVDDLVG
jgi:hypothetical protein